MYVPRYTDKKILDIRYQVDSKRVCHAAVYADNEGNERAFYGECNCRTDHRGVYILQYRQADF